MPVIPALKRLRQENRLEFQSNLGYIISWSPPWTTQLDPILKKERRIQSYYTFHQHKCYQHNGWKSMPHLISYNFNYKINYFTILTWLFLFWTICSWCLPIFLQRHCCSLVFFESSLYVSNILNTANIFLGFHLFLSIKFLTHKDFVLHNQIYQTVPLLYLPLF